MVTGNKMTIQGKISPLSKINYYFFTRAVKLSSVLRLILGTEHIKRKADALYQGVEKSLFLGFRHYVTNTVQVQC